MDSCTICIKKSDIFQCLSDDELGLINANKKCTNYKKGNLIISQGAEASDVMALTGGRAKIFIEGQNQKKLILGFLRPTEFFGSHGLYADDIHHYNVVAMEPSTVCVIDKVVFKHLIKTNPDFSEGFIKHICRNSVSNFQRNISLTQKQMPGRIADSFLYLYNSNLEWIEEQKNADITSNLINISKSDLADLSNIAKDNVTRLLKHFEIEGVINIKGTAIELLNISKLKELSRFG